MLRRDVEKMIIGSVKELLKDSNYFHHSTVGPEYCRLTDRGERAIVDIVNLLGGRMANAIAQEDIERSKELVLNELKGK
jgi:hypothetical protein